MIDLGISPEEDNRRFAEMMSSSLRVTVVKRPKRWLWRQLERLIYPNTKSGDK